MRGWFILILICLLLGVSSCKEGREGQDGQVFLKLRGCLESIATVRVDPNIPGVPGLNHQIMRREHIVETEPGDFYFEYESITGAIIKRTLQIEADPGQPGEVTNILFEAFDRSQGPEGQSKYYILICGTTASTTKVEVYFDGYPDY